MSCGSQKAQCHILHYFLQLLLLSQSILWAGEKVRHRAGEPTSSALWVCKCDALAFAQAVNGAAVIATESHIQAAMAGKGTFAKFCTFLKENPADVCGHLLLVQRLPVGSISRVSWALHPKAGDVGDVLLPEQLKDVFGYGQHKRNMAREAAAAASATGKGAAQRRVHDGAGAIMPSSDRVACVTMLAPHTCQKSLMLPPVLPPDLPDLVSSADHRSAKIGDETGSDDASDHLSEAISLTSAAGLLRQQLKRRTNQGPTSKSVAATLQSQASAGERVEDLSMKNLGDKLAHYGIANSSMVKNVRRVILGTAIAVDETVVMELLQAAVAEAKADGDYAEIIEASAAEVTARALELAQQRYTAGMKRKMAGRKGPVPPFDAVKAGITPYIDVDEDGTQIRYPAPAALPSSPILPSPPLLSSPHPYVCGFHRYVLGYAIAPGYLRKGLPYFLKFSAIDVAFAKRRGGGQGSFYLEAILGGDRSIHPLLCMHIIAGECDAGMDLHCEHVKVAYDDALNAAGWVTGSDGGKSLISGLAKHRPDASSIRDNRHISVDIKSNSTRALHASLHDIPPSRRGEVEQIFEHLKEHDPKAYATLTSVPVEKWCRALMPPHVAHHGNKVTSMVEVLGMMAIPARCTNTLAASFFCMKTLIRSRWLHLYHINSMLTRTVPVRIEKLEAAALQRANEIKCSLDPEVLKSIQPGSVGDLLTSGLFRTAIVVRCDREGVIFLARNENVERRAWSFLHGGRDTVQQSHIVLLQCIIDGDYWNLCSCHGNVSCAAYCPHATYVLQFFSLTELLRKSWSTCRSCKQQLGDKAPVALTFDVVNARLNHLRTTAGKMPVFIQPRLANRNPGGRPKQSFDDRVTPCGEIHASAPAAMHDAGVHATGHRIPGLKPHSSQVNSHRAVSSASKIDATMKKVSDGAGMSSGSSSGHARGHCDAMTGFTIDDLRQVLPSCDEHLLKDAWLRSLSLNEAASWCMEQQGWATRRSCSSISIGEKWGNLLAGHTGVSTTDSEDIRVKAEPDDEVDSSGVSIGASLVTVTVIPPPIVPAGPTPNPQVAKMAVSAHTMPPPAIPAISPPSLPMSKMAATARTECLVSGCATGMNGPIAGAAEGGTRLEAAAGAFGAALTGGAFDAAEDVAKAAEDVAKASEDVAKASHEGTFMPDNVSPQAASSPFTLLTDLPLSDLVARCTYTHVRYVRLQSHGTRDMHIPVSATEEYNLPFQWEQPYGAIVSLLQTLMQQSHLATAVKHAELDRMAFANTLVWDGCYLRPTDLLQSPMHQVLMAMHNDTAVAVHEDQGFRVSMRTLEVAGSALEAAGIAGSQECADSADKDAILEVFQSDSFRCIIEQVAKMCLNTCGLLARTCWGALNRVTEELQSLMPPPICEGSWLLAAPQAIPGQPVRALFNEPPMIVDGGCQQEFQHVLTTSKDAERRALWLRVYDNQLTNPPFGFHVDTSFGTIPLGLHDLLLLGPGRWMNDDLMNAFIGLVKTRMEEVKLIEPSLSYFHPMTSLFAEMLRTRGWQGVQRSKVLRRLRGTATRQATKIDGFIFPLNINGSHWIGVKIHFIKMKDADMWEVKLHGMDSMTEVHHVVYNELLARLVHGLQSEWATYGAQSFLPGPIHPSTGTAMDVIIVGRTTTPMQRDGHACGMFVLRWIEHVSIGAPCNYTEHCMNAFRSLALLELYHGRLLREVYKQGGAQLSIALSSAQLSIAVQHLRLSCSRLSDAMQQQLTGQGWAGQPLVHAASCVGYLRAMIEGADIDLACMADRTHKTEFAIVEKVSQQCVMAGNCRLDGHSVGLPALEATLGPQVPHWEECWQPRAVAFDGFMLHAAQQRENSAHNQKLFLFATVDNFETYQAYWRPENQLQEQATFNVVATEGQAAAFNAVMASRLGSSAPLKHVQSLPTLDAMHHQPRLLQDAWQFLSRLTGLRGAIARDQSHTQLGALLDDYESLDGTHYALATDKSAVAVDWLVLKAHIGQLSRSRDSSVPASHIGCAGQLVKLFSELDAELEKAGVKQGAGKVIVHLLDVAFGGLHIDSLEHRGVLKGRSASLSIGVPFGDLQTECAELRFPGVQQSVPFWQAVPSSSYPSNDGTCKLEELHRLYPHAILTPTGDLGIWAEWTADHVNARASPWNNWLQQWELPETPLGAFVYFEAQYDQRTAATRMVPIHVALESELLSRNGHPGQWALYPGAVGYSGRNGTLRIGEMGGVRCKGGPWKKDSPALRQAAASIDSKFLWERGIGQGKVELWDASGMHCGSAKCINDPSGLSLPSGEPASANCTMEPDGTISLDAGMELHPLTGQNRPSLATIEYLMLYGSAYPLPSAAPVPIAKKHGRSSSGSGSNPPFKPHKASKWKARGAGVTGTRLSSVAGQAGHAFPDWSAMQKTQPMVLSRSSIPAGLLRNVTRRGHLKMIDATSGGGLCGDVALSLVRHAMKATLGNPRCLADILLAERRFLFQLAERKPDALGKATGWNENTKRTMLPLVEANIMMLRDLEVEDLAVSASSLGLPLVVFSSQTGQKMVDETGRLRKQRTVDYPFTVFHVGLSQEVQSMTTWVGMVQQKEHWLLLAAYTDSEWHVVLGKSEYELLLESVGTDKVEVIDFSTLTEDLVESFNVTKDVRAWCVSEDSTGTVEISADAWKAGEVNDAVANEYLRVWGKSLQFEEPWKDCEDGRAMASQPQPSTSSSQALVEGKQTRAARKERCAAGVFEPQHGIHIGLMATLIPCLCPHTNLRGA